MQSAGTRGIRPIRLLVIDDSPDMVRNVEKLLHFEPDIQVVGSASNAEEAFVAVADLHGHDVSSARARVHHPRDELRRSRLSRRAVYRRADYRHNSCGRQVGRLAL